MKIYKTQRGIVIQHHQQYFLSDEKSWDRFVNRTRLHQCVLAEPGKLKPDAALAELVSREPIAPIGSQEVWASGVTYLRSREARMEESIHRFTRPVCYQSMPDTLLPDELKDKNPLNLWRMVNGERTKKAVS